MRMENVRQLAAMDPGKPMPVWAQKLGVHVARAYLASQEQTPDYEAAAKVIWRYDQDEYDYSFEGNRLGYMDQAKAIVDAALVGFHPQPGPSMRGAHMCGRHGFDPMQGDVCPPCQPEGDER